MKGEKCYMLLWWLKQERRREVRKLLITTQYILVLSPAPGTMLGTELTLNNCVWQNEHKKERKGVSLKFYSKLSYFLNQENN